MGLKVIKIPKEIKEEKTREQQQNWEEYTRWLRMNGATELIVTRENFERRMEQRECAHCGMPNEYNRWVCDECCELEGIE